MPDETPAPARSMRDLSGAVIKQLVAGRTQDVVIKQLTDRGWPEVSARHFVANAAQTAVQHIEEDDQERAYIAEVCRRRMIRGLILTFISVILMLLFFTLSGLLRIVSFFFLSMAVFGFLDFLTALAGWLRYRK